MRRCEPASQRIRRRLQKLLSLQRRLWFAELALWPVAVTLQRLGQFKSAFPAHVSADIEFRDRFNREADQAATLYHPHIVGVHDRGEFNGQLWISMDYVEGRRRRPADESPVLDLPLPTAIAWTRVRR
jgi:serine/threonine protein kinase